MCINLSREKFSFEKNLKKTSEKRNSEKLLYKIQVLAFFHDNLYIVKRYTELKRYPYIGMKVN